MTLRIFVQAFALALTLSGCSSVSKLAQSVMTAGADLVGVSKPHPHPAPWHSVTVVASADANQNSPVALDLVFVRDPALLESLSTTPAAKWFATRADTQRSFPDTLGVVSLEVVPGQTFKLTDPARIRQSALGILAFASYPTPGEHRLRLHPSTDSFLLQLGPQGFQGADVSSHVPK
jgi:type VI secretion system protein